MVPPASPSRTDQVTAMGVVNCTDPPGDSETESGEMTMTGGRVFA
jgi:hypothetical protein